METITKHTLGYLAALVLTGAAVLVASRLQPGQFGQDGGQLVSGVLTGADGEAIAGATVALVPGGRSPEGLPAQRLIEHRDGGRRATTNADGAFRFEAIEAGALWIGATGEVAGSAPLDAPPVLQLFEKVADVALDGLDVVVERGVFLTGDVLLHAGGPAEEGSVFGEHVGTGMRFEASIASDGTFTLGPLVRGEYRLLADSEGAARSREVRHVAGAAPVRLTLREGSDVSFVLGPKRPGGWSVVSALLSEAGTHEPIAPDLFQPLHLHSEDPAVPIGVYDLTVTTHAGHVGRALSVDVAPGGRPVEITVDLAPGAPIRVEVDSPSVVGYTLSADGALWGVGHRSAFTQHHAPVGAVVVRGFSAKGEPIEERVVETQLGVDTVVKL